MSEYRFDGRVAVITGAGRGLRRAYAEFLGSKGAKVIVNDVGANVEGEGIYDAPAEEVLRAVVNIGGEAVSSADSVATEEGWSCFSCKGNRTIWAN